MAREGDPLGLFIVAGAAIVVVPAALFGGQRIELGASATGTSFAMRVDTGIAVENFPDMRSVQDEATFEASNYRSSVGREFVSSFCVIDAVSGRRLDRLVDDKHVVDLKDVGDSPIAMVATVDGRKEVSKTYLISVNDNGDLEYPEYEGDTPALPSTERQNRGALSNRDDFCL